MSFKTKVALITGAYSGIGAAAAIKFAQKGANVVITGRQQDKLRNLSAKCEAAGSKPLVIIADVTNDEDLKRIVSTTNEHFGKLDILINNAGFISIESIVSNNAMQCFDKTMATNLRSAVHLTHLAAPYLIKTKGNIINISTISAKRVLLHNCFAYTTSKAGLDHFTRCIALELGPKGVRVNSVNPGPVRTDIVKNMNMDKTKEEALWSALKQSAPLRKIAVPEEVADLIAYIASDKARSITGSSFVLDNGELINTSLSILHDN